MAYYGEFLFECVQEHFKEIDLDLKEFVKHVESFKEKFYGSLTRYDTDKLFVL